MGDVIRAQFRLSRRFDVDPRELWDELVDWPAHGDWIPATTIVAEPGVTTSVGYTFTAWTGFRPIALEDRMRVTRCDWDETARIGVCEVEKLGPVLVGGAGFTVAPPLAVGGGSPRAEASGAVLEWREDVTVAYLPRFLSPIATFAGRSGFALALRRLAKTLERRAPGR